MPQIIKDFGVVACVDVQPASPEKEVDWSGWHRDYIGRDGWLRLIESEKKRPGKRFLCFFGGQEGEKDWWLHTGYGQLTEYGIEVLVPTAEEMTAMAEAVRAEVYPQLNDLFGEDVMNAISEQVAGLSK